MAGRFPGAHDVGELWRNLCSGKESISRFTEAELEVDPALAKRPNYVRARGIIEDADKFDAAFFGINPREAELIDPQQRIFLECCWHALEDAGYDPLQYKGVAAVYAGCSFNSYFMNSVCSDRGFRDLYTAGYQVENFIATLGSNFDFLPTRVSYKLNLRGPAHSLNCGCSTSLVAVCQACLSLQNYQCDLALAGGVSITFPQKRGYLYEPGGMVSPDGHCRSFDAAAQGTVFGDGAAVVLLKRLADAVADGDQIYAVVKGFGINNDGAEKVGFTAPSVDGQAKAIAMAHAAAGVDPASVSYVETHGTATPLGDPIEIAALTQAFRRTTSARQFCAIGTAKTNLGHLDVAAGVTGLIKTALSLRHKTLPPTLHFKSPSPELKLEDSPFRVNAELTPWQRGATPLRAGVSAFGIGGTNAHVILEEAPEAERSPSQRTAHLLLVSARTPTALDEATSNLARHFSASDGAELADVAYTLMVGRRAFDARRMTVVHDSAEAAAVLTELPQGRVFTRVSKAERLAVAFMFPGQGAQYPGMGQRLYEDQPLFREHVDTCLKSLETTSGICLKAVFSSGLSGELSAERLDDTKYAQPALFVVEYALARLWIGLGIQPTAMLGHSVGEFVAATLAGVFSLEDALRLVAARGRLMQDLPRGSMLSVRLGEDCLAGYLGAELSVAAVNGPNLTVVAGTDKAVSELAAQFEQEGIACRRLRTSHAFHSHMMDQVRAPFAELARGVHLNPPTVPFISSVTGTWITDAEATDPEYWASHLRQPVQFSRAVQILRAGDCALLEAGPGNTLSVLARQHPARHSEQLVVSSLPDRAGKQTDDESILNALGHLWLYGAEPDWSQLYANEQRRRVSLPLYPFERKRFWIGPDKVDQAWDQATSTGHQDAATAFDSFADRQPETTATGTRYSDQAGRAEPSAGTNNMESAHLNDRQTPIRSILKSIFEDLSGIDMSDAAGSTSFLELGFDSLFLTQVSQALQTRFGIKITFRQLLDQFSTLESLSSYLSETVPSDPLPKPAPAAPATMTDGPAAGAADLDAFFKNQLKMMSDLMSKQLEVLRGVGIAAQGTAPQQAPKAADAAMQPLTPNGAKANGVPIGNSHGPQPRKFIPFRPVHSEPGSDFTAAQQQSLRTLTERYNRKTAGSKRLAQEHRQHLADPRTAAGFRSEWKELIYPIVTVRSKGSKLWDVDGNQYVDLVNGYGPIMFGHAPEFVTRAIEDQLKLGYETGPQSPLAGQGRQSNL